MKRLLLIRHAIAEDFASSGLDCDRNLTEDGKIKFQAVAKGLRQVIGTIDCALHSPYRRCVQTADILKDHGTVNFLKSKEILSAGRLQVKQDLLNLIDSEMSQFNSVAIVGHNPDLEIFLNWLSDGKLFESDSLEFRFKKGMVVSLKTFNTCQYVLEGVWGAKTFHSLLGMD